MGQANRGVSSVNPGQKSSHLPYAVRYVARLQERAAHYAKNDGKPDDELYARAWQSRVAASLISQGVPVAKKAARRGLLSS